VTGRLGPSSAPALALLLGACASPGLYDWGDYEGSVRRVSNESEGFDVAAEIDRLETTLEQAQNADRAVPPGFHAHLGYLLYVNGDAAGAASQFETEKARYPESRRFVDFMLARISGSQGSRGGS